MENLNTGLSPGELRIFMIAMTCAVDGLNNVKIDFDLLADKAGLKNASSANVLYGNARRKLLAAPRIVAAQASTGSTGSGSNPTTPKTKEGRVAKHTPKSSTHGKGKTAKAIAAAALEAYPSPSKTKVKGESEADSAMTAIMDNDKEVKLENTNVALADNADEVAHDVATEMIKGTSYPRSELEWSFFEQSMWHVGTYD
ncbi:hypothetical protein GX48_07841 [Paracoccidioides brasiliensis]|nr:hypothetical protein GX48_07841 [Paracoccidioides brasiliensis]